MKKNLLLGGGIIFLMALIILGIRFLSGDEDTWICQNGAWVKHGNPNAEMPSVPCEKSITDMIRVTSPKTNATIASPFEITGEARGNWYFEASFPIKLLDKDGKEIGSAIAGAQSDWMTENFVPFKAILEFTASYSGDVSLVFMKDNPSGSPENDAEFSVPVKIEKSETIAVKAFFNNSQLDPEASCNKVFSTERTIAKTEAVARAALLELLKGPTEEEKRAGFFTSINPNVKIQTLTIENGIAKVDFDEQLEFQVGGSCRVSAIRSQITETLRQFPTVKNVVISINGRTEDILQP